MLTPWKVYVYCDQRLHPELQKAIVQLVERMAVRSVGADALCADLQKEYPLVSLVSIAYKGSLSAIVSVKTHMPWVCVAAAVPGQKEYVLCKAGLIIEKKYFNELALQGVPAVTIEAKDFMQAITDPDLLSCILELKRAIFDDYSITWKSKVEIILRSKALNIEVIADTITVHESERFDYVDRIFNSDSDRYKNGMKADIRLKDEIICSSFVGKKVYEKSVNI